MSTDWERTRPPLKRITSPAAPGNDLALKHGASSERAISERAAYVHEQITAVAPWLGEPHFAPAVHRYLRAAARESLLDDWIAEVAATKGAGAVSSRSWEQVTAAARLAARLGSDLGLDPIGHARLKAVAGSAAVTEVTLGDLMAQGRESRLAAEARMAAEAAPLAVEPLEAVEATVEPSEGADGDRGGVA